MSDQKVLVASSLVQVHFDAVEDAQLRTGQEGEFASYRLYTGIGLSRGWVRVYDHRAAVVQPFMAQVEGLYIHKGRRYYTPEACRHALPSINQPAYAQIKFEGDDLLTETGYFINLFEPRRGVVTPDAVLFYSADWTAKPLEKGNPLFSWAGEGALTMTNGGRRTVVTAWSNIPKHQRQYWFLGREATLLEVPEGTISEQQLSAFVTLGILPIVDVAVLQGGLS